MTEGAQREGLRVSGIELSAAPGYRVLAAAAVWALHILILAHSLSAGPPRWMGLPAEFRGIDVRSMARAGRSALHGWPLYGLVEGQAVKGPATPPFRYPPVAAYTLGVFLSLLPAASRALVWLLLCEVVLIIDVLLVVTTARSLMTVLAGSALWLLTIPVFDDLWLGQYSLVTASLVFWAWLAWRLHTANDRYENSFRLATTLWTVSVLLKGFPFVYAPMLWSYPARRQAVRTCVSLLAVTSLVYFSWNPHDFMAFLHLNFDPRYAWIIGENEGLWSLIAHSAWGQYGASDVTLRVLGFLIVVVVFGIAMAITSLAKRDLERWLTGLWTCAFLLTFKEVWTHHLCFLFPFTSLIVYNIWEHPRGIIGKWDRPLSYLALILLLWIVSPIPFSSDSYNEWLGVNYRFLWRPIPELLLFGLCCTAAIVQTPLLKSTTESGDCERFVVGSKASSPGRSV